MFGATGKTLLGTLGPTLGCLASSPDFFFNRLTSFKVRFMGRERRRERDLHLLVQLAEARSKELCPGLPGGWQGPQPSAACRCIPQAIGREVEQKWRSYCLVPIMVCWNHRWQLYLLRHNTGQTPLLIPDSCAPWEAASGGSNSWVPVTNLGDLDELVLDSWHWPGPELAIISVHMTMSILFPCL